MAMYVDPDLWGNGIGSQLLEQAMDSFKTAGCTVAELWVMDGNERAALTAVRARRLRTWRESTNTPRRTDAPSAPSAARSLAGSAVSIPRKLRAVVLLAVSH